MDPGGILGYSPIRWLDALSFPFQLLVLAAILDPIGAAVGYALHPSLGVGPFMGAALGVMVAGSLIAAWIVRYQLRTA